MLLQVSSGTQHEFYTPIRRSMLKCVQLSFDDSLSEFVLIVDEEEQSVYENSAMQPLHCTLTNVG